MNSQSSSEVKNKTSLTEQAIVDYLRSHPDFFNRHSGLLAELAIPHDAGGAVSLIERQVSVLRQQQSRLQQRIDEQMEIARQNDDISERVHQLVLKIIESRGFNDVAHAVISGLKQEFGLEAVSIKIVGRLSGEQAPDDDLTGLFAERKEASATLLSLMQFQEPLCGKLSPEQMHYLFKDHAEKVHSAALLPLGFGVVALGSYDPQRFNAGMATHFLKHLAEVIACKLKNYIEADS